MKINTVQLAGALIISFTVHIAIASTLLDAVSTTMLSNPLIQGDQGVNIHLVSIDSATTQAASAAPPPATETLTEPPPIIAPKPAPEEPKPAPASAPPEPKPEAVPKARRPDSSRAETQVAHSAATDILPLKERADATSLAQENSRQHAQQAATGTQSQQDYLSQLAQSINQHKRYPNTARRQRRQGVVQVEFAINPHGHIIRSRILHSSGHTLLDQEALDMLQRAQPLPGFTDTLHSAELVIILPVVFDLRQR